MDSLYSGSASFGKFQAGIGAVFGFIFGLLFIIIGIVMLRSKNVYTAKTTGTVTLANCSGPSDQISCSLTVNYTIDSKPITASVSSFGPNTYTVGEVVTIYYNPNNPTDAKLSVMSKVIPVVVLCLGLFTVIGSFLNYYMTRKYKFAAAAEGIGGGINIAKQFL